MAGKSIKQRINEWLARQLERMRVIRANQYVDDMERQIREQLNQHHSLALTTARAEGFQEGIYRTRDAYTADNAVLHATAKQHETTIVNLTNKLAFITAGKEVSSERKEGKSAARRTKAVQRRSKPRKSRRV